MKADSYISLWKRVTIYLIYETFALKILKIKILRKLFEARRGRCENSSSVHIIK